MATDRLMNLACGNRILNALNALDAKIKGEAAPSPLPTTANNRLMTLDCGINIATAIENITEHFQAEPTSFAGASNERIAELISQADRGLIDLEQDLGWAVGDKRTGSSASYSLILAARADEYTLASALPNGDTHGHFIVLLEYVTGNVNSNTLVSSNVGGATDFTLSSAYTTFYGANALLSRALSDVGLSSSAKEFYCPTLRWTGTSAGNYSVRTDFVTKISAPSIKEVTGSTNGSGAEADLYTQWPYFQVAANRIRKDSSSASAKKWYTRSAQTDSYSKAAAIDESGEYYSAANVTNGTALCMLVQFAII